MHSGTALALLLLLAQNVAAFSVPLEKRVPVTHQIKKDGECDLSAIRLNVQAASDKYYSNSINLAMHLTSAGNATAEVKLLAAQRLHRHKRRASISARPLTAHGGYWTGVLQIGTPSRSFKIDFDTGSTDAVLCGSTACARGGTRRIYKPKQSKTSKRLDETFENWYGDGSKSSGRVYTETVSVGALRAKQVNLNVATSMAGALSNLDIDGVMGFSFPALSSTMEGTTFSANLLAQGVTKTDTVGFRLSETAGESEVFWGGYNKKKTKGKIFWYDIGTDPVQEGIYTYMQLSNSYHYVNGKRIAETKSSYILDTGTTLIIAPPKAAKAFWAAVPYSQALSGDNAGYYSFPCSSPPTVTLTFAGKPYQHAVAPADLNLGKVGTSTTRCMGAVVGYDAGVGDAWIVGDAFLKNHYSIFSTSKMQIGLSRI